MLPQNPPAEIPYPSVWTAPGIRLAAPLGARVELAPVWEDHEDSDHEDSDHEGTDDPETAETDKSDRLFLR